MQSNRIHHAINFSLRDLRFWHLNVVQMRHQVAKHTALAAPCGDNAIGTALHLHLGVGSAFDGGNSWLAHLAFAGGRDTVIHSISSTLAYLGRNAAALPWLREDPRRIVNACEEIFRHVSPLTHIGRVCPVDTDVHGVPVKAGGSVSLCWASANHDATVFDQPEEVRLDRKPNPHMAFGAGAHLCRGAAHARLLLRTLLQACIDHVGRVEVLAAEERVEDEASYRRVMGYESLTVRLHPHTGNPVAP